MRRNGWKTALPVFLLSATLSTAVLAAGGLGMGDLGRAVPDIAPVPYVSPFAVVDGVAVTAPAAADDVAEQPLVAFNRIPQAPSRSADTPPRPRPVQVAGETVPIDPPGAVAEVRPRVHRPRRDADREAGHAHGGRDDAVAPDAAPAPDPAPGGTPEDKSKPGKADEPDKAGETPKDAGGDDTPGEEARDSDGKDDKRVHTASADGDNASADDAGPGERRDNGDGGDEGAKQPKDSKDSGGGDAKARRA